MNGIDAAARRPSLLTAAFDASSGILLYKAAPCRKPVWTALALLYEMVMSREVWHEITRPGYPGAEFFLERSASLEVVDGPAEMKWDDRPLTLGSGERSTIALYVAGQVDFIVVDDRQAAHTCLREGIPFVNALLLPRLLSLAGVLDRGAAAGLADELGRIGRYSPAVKRFALQCPVDHLRRFLPLDRQPLPVAGRSSVVC